MKEPVKNVAASVLARLKNESARQGRSFAEILQYYGMERFLFRLSKTKYADKFILKGGLLFYVWDIPMRRPTKDIDFRGYVTNRHDQLRQIISDIIAEPVPDDGIVFDMGTLEIESAQIDAEYEGIRINFIGRAGRSRIPIQIDIGFSDEIKSRMESINYPHLLAENEDIQMQGYSKELVVAEKFHAMVDHADLTAA